MGAPYADDNGVDEVNREFSLRLGAVLVFPICYIRVSMYRGSVASDLLEAMASFVGCCYHTRNDAVSNPQAVE